MKTKPAAFVRETSVPFYNYLCLDCAKKAKRKLKRELSAQDELEHAMFETSHSMFPSDSELAEAKICPRCNKSNTQLSLFDMHVQGYVAGNGFLDIAGAKRDMNLYHLTEKDETGKTIDPYASMREPGEVDDLKSKLKRAGRKGGKGKHYVVSDKAMQGAVKKAMRSKPID